MRGEFIMKIFRWLLPLAGLWIIVLGIVVGDYKNCRLNSLKIRNLKIQVLAVYSWSNNYAVRLFVIIQSIYVGGRYIIHTADYANLLWTWHNRAILPSEKNGKALRSRGNRRIRDLSCSPLGLV